MLSAISRVVSELCIRELETANDVLHAIMYGVLSVSVHYHD